MFAENKDRSIDDIKHCITKQLQPHTVSIDEQIPIGTGEVKETLRCVNREGEAARISSNNIKSPRDVRLPLRKDTRISWNFMKKKFSVISRKISSNLSNLIGRVNFDEKAKHGFPLCDDKVP